MDDDRVAADAPQPTPDPERRPVIRPKRNRWRLWLVGILLVPLLIGVAWTAITLNWAYSSGDRAGYVQKFSRKGWLCKTYEGEIAQVSMPGTAPQIFPFSVRDDSVAAQITRLMGAQVSIHYDEHRGVPGSCFGDTQYFVTGVRALSPAVAPK